METIINWLTNNLGEYYLLILYLIFLYRMSRLHALRKNRKKTERYYSSITQKYIDIKYNHLKK